MAHPVKGRHTSVTYESVKYKRLQKVNSPEAPIAFKLVGKLKLEIKLSMIQRPKCSANPISVTPYLKTIVCKWEGTLVV